MAARKALVKFIADGSATWQERETPYMAAQNEHADQAALFSWAAMQSKRFPEFERLLFAVPNGGQRKKATAGMLRAEGVKAGTPDVFLTVSRPAALLAGGLYSGLVIEHKKQGNYPTPEQKAFLEAAAAQGYYVAVSWAWEASRDLITAYMEGKL